MHLTWILSFSFDGEDAAMTLRMARVAKAAT